MVGGVYSVRVGIGEPGAERYCRSARAFSAIFWFIVRIGVVTIERMIRLPVLHLPEYSPPNPVERSPR